NGFIEVYRDARGAKGSAQSFVSITDKPVTDAMTKLAQNAAYFEEKAPWAPKYKKQAFNPPVVKAVQLLIETGDFHVTTIGDNLPNENEIHEKYGTESHLKEYFSALEEARADLMALWNIGDRKLSELQLVKDQEEVARAMYDAAARVALTQLRRIPRGDTIEEDHQRDRQLIVNF